MLVKYKDSRTLKGLKRHKMQLLSECQGNYINSEKIEF